MTRPEDLLYAVDEMPPWPRLLVLGMQHAMLLLTPMEHTGHARARGRKLNGPYHSAIWRTVRNRIGTTSERGRHPWDCPKSRTPLDGLSRANHSRSPDKTVSAQELLVVSECERIVRTAVVPVGSTGTSSGRSDHRVGEGQRQRIAIVG